MTIEKYIKVELCREDKDVLLKAAEIINELHEAIGDDSYSIDFDEISHSLQHTAYMDYFEVNENY